MKVWFDYNVRGLMELHLSGVKDFNVERIKQLSDEAITEHVILGNFQREDLSRLRIAIDAILYED